MGGGSKLSLAGRASWLRRSQDFPLRGPEGRKCYACGEERPLEEFARDGSKASGRKGLCKLCDRAKSSRYYEANRDAKLAKAAERNARRRGGPRLCDRCGEPATSSRHWFCDVCRDAGARRRRRRPGQAAVPPMPFCEDCGNHHVAGITCSVSLTGDEAMLLVDAGWERWPRRQVW